MKISSHLPSFERYSLSIQKTKQLFRNPVLQQSFYLRCLFLFCVLFYKFNSYILYFTQKFVFGSKFAFAIVLLLSKVSRRWILVFLPHLSVYYDCQRCLNYTISYKGIKGSCQIFKVRVVRLIFLPFPTKVSFSLFENVSIDMRDEKILNTIASLQ